MTEKETNPEFFNNTKTIVKKQTVYLKSQCDEKETFTPDRETTPKKDTTPGKTISKQVVYLKNKQNEDETSKYDNNQ